MVLPPNSPPRKNRNTQRLCVRNVPTLVSQFDSVANVTYPGAYGRFLDAVSAMVNLDVSMVLSAGCIVNTNFHDRLLVSTLGPIIALGLLGVTYFVALRRNSHSHDALQSVLRKHFSVTLLITFLVYSSVSSTVFRMFACETLDDGIIYLRADYSIECDSRKHEALKVSRALLTVGGGGGGWSTMGVRSPFPWAPCSPRQVNCPS